MQKYFKDLHAQYEQKLKHYLPLYMQDVKEVTAKYFKRDKFVIVVHSKKGDSRVFIIEIFDLKLCLDSFEKGTSSALPHCFRNGELKNI